MKNRSNTLGDACVAIVAVGIVLFSISMPYAATTITKTTTKNGTVTLSAIAKGDARSASLPCTDGSVRQCKSACADGACSVTAEWKTADGQTGSAGAFAFTAGEDPAPDSRAHRWCLSLLNSMGSPLGTGATAKSSIRSVTRNGRASINGYACPKALEPDVFGP